jgi:glycosyltransferase involved in cell wall biosynthesis
LGHGGIGVYTENLVSGLLAQGEVRLDLLCSRDRAAQYEWFGDVGIVEESSKPYSLDEMFLLGRRIRQSEYDLYHAPHFTLPYGLKIPTVVTLHDLIHIYHPEKPFYPYIAGPMIRSAVKRATRVITVSNATFQELKKFQHNREGLSSKVRVVPNALDPYFYSGGANGEQVVSRFHLRGKYLIAVCSMLKPHKGLHDLLLAFQGVQDHFQQLCHFEQLPRCDSELKLVLVGQGTEKMVEKEGLFEIAGSIKGVHIFGSVTKQELAALYGSALALVVPSTAEGFCLPVIEAQAFGTPVIARPVPAILELLGSEDVKCADFSVSALREGILKFLNTHSGGDRRKNPVQAAANVQRFRREDVARSVLQIYHEAITDFKGSR